MTPPPCLYLAAEGQTHGPFPWATIQRHVSRRELNRDAWAWHDGCDGWVRLDQVPGLIFPASDPARYPPPLPSKRLARMAPLSRRPCTWVATLLLGLLAAIAVLFALLFAAHPKAGWMPEAIVLALLPLPIFVRFFRSLDPLEPEPTHLLLFAFLWGATAAVFLASLFNGLFAVVSIRLLGPAWAGFLSFVFCAPVVEETSKGLAVLILFLWKRDEIDGLVDGILYAAMVGLGFAAMENITYYADTMGDGFLAGGADGRNISGANIFLLRGLMSPFAHPLFTAWTGIGFARAARTNDWSKRILYPVLGLAIAMAVHAAWNFLPGLGTLLHGGKEPEPSICQVGVKGFVAFGLVFGIPMMAGVVALIAVSSAENRRYLEMLRRNLAPERNAGIFRPTDYATLCSVYGRLAAQFIAQLRGRNEGRAMRRFHGVGTRLALHREKLRAGPPPFSLDQHRAEEAALAAELTGICTALKTERYRWTPTKEWLSTCGLVLLLAQLALWILVYLALFVTAACTAG